MVANSSITRSWIGGFTNLIALDFVSLTYMLKILSKIFPNSKGIGQGLADIVDKFVHTKEEKAQFEKEMTEMFHKADENEQKHTTERWKLDMSSDSWLSKNVRPMMLIAFFILILALVVMDSGVSTFVVATHWVSLIQSLALTIFGAYFGDRAIRGYQTIKNQNRKDK